MKKICSCGAEMDITIRTVYFNRNVKVENVPVYSCTVCERHQLMEQMSTIMKDMIEEVTRSVSKGKKEVLSLEEHSELAQLILMAYDHQQYPDHDDSIQDDVQNLLEDFLLDGEVEESYYIEEVRRVIEKYAH